jgi:adenosylhomocysteine nucleosidase
MQEQIIGIMGAMPEEINEVINLLETPSAQTTGKRTYHTGQINGINVVVVVSGWGKVAAAATISTLIIRFNITSLIFTGVAGAINSDVKIGDIVLAKRLIQHDMDARPFIPRYEIPLTGKTFFETEADQLSIAADAIQHLLQSKQLSEATHGVNLTDFGISAPALHIGDVASGDKFFSADIDKRRLQESLPSVLCVEMEGAAVAQVCDENNIPFTIIRTISDASDDHSVIDFQAFIKRVASKYSVTIIRNIFGMP